MMPGLAGGDVIGMCRLTGDRTPFVVVTGAPHAIADTIRRAHDVILLPKPFTIGALFDAVARALDASADQRGR
jgi:FixJ family two-component response regulator